MVGHDDVAVQVIVGHRLSVMINRVYGSLGHFRSTQVSRSSARFVEQTVHCNEASSGCALGRELTTLRQTSGQAPCQEYRLAYSMHMRQPTAMERYHISEWPLMKEILLGGI